MPDFTNFFVASKGQPITYKGQIIYGLDRFPVKNSDVLIAHIETANSEYRQGFCIDITGHCEMDGKTFKKEKGIRMLFWQDTAPQEIRLKVFTKKDHVVVYNIWEQTNYYLAGGPKESKSVEFWNNGAAMMTEEIENGRRYRCNDGTPDEDFNDIVFTVQRIR